MLRISLYRPNLFHMTRFKTCCISVCVLQFAACDPGHSGKTVFNNESSYSFEMKYKTHLIQDTMIPIKPHSINEVYHFGGLGAGKDFDCCLCKFLDISLSLADTTKSISKQINDSRNWLIVNGNKKRFSHEEITCSFLIEQQDIH